MADLLLHEQRVPAVLDQVRDVGAAQRVEVQPGRQAERRRGRRRSGVDLGQPDPRSARSEGHSAALASVLLGLAASSGRTVLVHSSRTSAVHGQTVNTLRRFGAEPFIALPWRT